VAELGFIGLGIMGKPMASYVVKAGRPIHVYGIIEETVKYLYNLGAKRCSFSKTVPC
jgi:3-hydroxyisobutyrate dehydrogenase-like beta-hydroxyacid dehydrogenase